MRRVYRRDAELFNGTAAAGLLQEGKTRDQHKLQTLRRRMRGIVEDVLWEGGVLTTDEIYRGVKAKHAQLGQLLPPRWQEEVRANPRGPLHFARGQFVVSRKHRTIDKANPRGPPHFARGQFAIS